MTASVEPASFRDPSSTVFYSGGEVYRGLGDVAAGDWKALNDTAFFPRVLKDGRVVGTEVVDAATLVDGLPAASGKWPVVLKHERIPFISYPYEWTFSQLRDAALLHLDLLSLALDEGLTMKDGYAYNVQWRGAQPTFIDVPSFERNAGGPWVGYRQFCQTFLFPLLIQAHRDIPFRPWLRAAIDGISPQQARAMLGGRDMIRKGVLKHVVLHSAMDTKMSSNKEGSEAFKKELSESGFSSDLTKATVKAIRKTVDGLRYKAADSHWETYQQTSTYTDDERAVKAAFVDSQLGSWTAQTPLGLVWDMGCNDGTYSRLAAQHADSVVAVDGDEQTIDSLYRALKQERNKKILPLVMNLTDPSPGIGWRGKERLPFETRRKPDAILCLALVHHLALTANVPLPQILDWYADFGARLIIEWVDPADPMGKRLLSLKPAGTFPDYRQDVFERLLEERFVIDRRETLSSGTRTLFAATPRA
jgi:SAM-dependent methyltransferase